jgi:hypothetical protein
MTQAQPFLPLACEPRVITNVAFGKKKEVIEQPIYTPDELPCLFVLGASVKCGAEVTTFVCYVDIDDERRAIVHFALGRSAAVELHKTLGEALS